MNFTYFTFRNASEKNKRLLVMSFWVRLMQSFPEEMEENIRTGSPGLRSPSACV